MFTYRDLLNYTEETNKEIEKEKKLKEFESYKKIKTALNHIEKNYITKLTTDDLDEIGYALTVYKSNDKRKEYLEKHTPNLSKEAIEELLKLSFSKVGNLSLKAMKKIIPELEKGVTYDKAVDKVYEDFRGTINTQKKRKLRLKDFEQEISNPVVRRGLSQAIKVLNAITLRYNEKFGKPDVVVVELARELGKNFADRRTIEKRQSDNMQTNEKAKESIIALVKNNPTGKDIVKFKLWQDQDCKCIYSGKTKPVEELFTDFMEFHGDRYYQDDKAIIGGIARFHGMPVTVIAQAKGRTTKENIERNFGMPSPDGYRKALRLMKQAEKFNRPVICFVDTPGAFCGLEAEERGQGEAIARNLFEMSNLQVPILSVVIGEGGSGGALAMATSDEVWLLENSIYSILSPEGFASILWKDSSRAKEAAGVMKLTADRLLKAGIVERVIPEPENFNLETFTEVTDPMDDYISIFLKKYGAMTKEELTEKRYDRFRRM